MMLEGTLVYADHAHYGQTAQFFLVLYIIFIGPIFLFFHRISHTPWVWAFFVAIPAVTAAETAIGYLLFLNRCETEAGITMLNPPPPTRGFIFVSDGAVTGFSMRCGVVCREGLEKSQFEFVEKAVFRRDKLAGTPTGIFRKQLDHRMPSGITGVRFERSPASDLECNAQEKMTSKKEVPGADYSMRYGGRWDFCIHAEQITSFRANVAYEESRQRHYMYSVRLARAVSLEDDTIFSERKRFSFTGGNMFRWIYEAVDITGLGMHSIACERRYDDGWLHTMVGVPIAR